MDWRNIKVKIDQETIGFMLGIIIVYAMILYIDLASHKYLKGTVAKNTIIEGECKTIDFPDKETREKININAAPDSP